MSQKPSFPQVILSAIAAAFGVQSDENRQRDFENGRFSHYIAAGILVTAIVIGAVFITVKIVLQSSGSQ